jgi:hypothetical protein
LTPDEFIRKGDVMRKKSILSVAMVVVGLLAGIAASRGSREGGNNLTPAEAKAIAQDAYVFGLPPVYFALNQEVMTNVAKPEGGRAPFNQDGSWRPAAVERVNRSSDL